MQQQFRYFDIAEFHQSFVMVPNAILGKGFDSSVYLVYEKSTQQKYALKTANFRDMQHAYNFNNEIRLLHFIQHKHIIQFIGNSKDCTCILLEYMPFGNLSQIVRNGLELPIVKGILMQLVNAVKYLHERNIVHGDIKLENALISKEFVVKLCDFGFAIHQKTPDAKLRGGSEGFTAPELHTSISYNAKKCDVFSLGIVFFILLLGHRPFLSNSPAKEDQYWRMIKSGRWDKFWQIFKDSKQITEEFKGCIESMLAPDPDNRLCIEQVAQLPWLSLQKSSDQEVEKYLQERFQK